jgi:hypothetical protein
MKNTNLVLFILAGLMVGFQSFAGPGDTIMVQTFTYEGYPVGEGWLAPREGFFDFSEVEGLDFAKVFIHYNLKCDNSQSPACGEWDYLSYIKVMEHTGIGYHPSYIIGGEGGLSPQQFSYMDDVSWKYEARWENSTVWTDPNELSSYLVGGSSIDMDYPFKSDQSDSRAYFLYRADELSAAGLTAGDITGLQFDVQNTGDPVQRLKIRMKNSSLSELTDHVSEDGFITVYYRDTEFASTGWQTFDFTEFFEWDGTSNVIIDIGFSSDFGETTTVVKGEEVGLNSSLLSQSGDLYFDFNGPDFIDVLEDNLASLENEITISFWLNGSEEQPQSDFVFEAVSENGNRLLGSHLPWGNGKIYWDAGFEANYDRIEKEADSPDQYKGSWNHWALVKKAQLGQMKIYFNGEIWHESTGKFLPIGEIANMIIGRGGNTSSDDRFYDGKLDEFRIWAKSLEGATIKDWMYKNVDDTHPDYDSLKVYYQFNSNVDFSTLEAVSGEYSSFQGIPQILDYDGKRIKDFQISQMRPQVQFNRNTSDYSITGVIVVDSLPNGPIQLDIFAQDAPGEEPYIDQSLLVYPTYYNNYVFDEDLNAIDSTLVEPDAELELEMIEYDTEEPGVEVLIPWEVGRFITPYGNNLSLGDDGWTWVYDVTDFQHLFQGDNVHIRAGNFQELLDMKVFFVEGTPPRDLLEVKQLYSKNPGLNVFDEVIVDTVVEILPEAKMLGLKTTLTGHGFGQGANCGEFCSNIHTVEVNGNVEFSWDILQECGDNPLYPQGGTWFYDRAGWCPGMPATQQNLDLTPFVNIGVDETISIDYDIEYDPYGNYVTEIFLLSYNEPNFQNDASIEEIIAPINFKLHSRFNPICANPIVKIKNTGANNLTTLTIEYGLEGMGNYTYQWEGDLSFLQEEIVQLPSMDVEDFQNASQLRFYVDLSNSNDEYEYNNYMVSVFESAPEHNQQLIVHFKTNKRPWENSYEIKDATGNIVFERGDFEMSSLHIDTLNLAPACYEFMAYDSGGDGMYDWPSNHGTGYIRFYDFDGNLVANLEEWFGEYIRYNFVNNANLVRVDDREKLTFNIYPNPSNGFFNLELITNGGEHHIKIYNTTASLVKELKLKTTAPGTHPIDLSELKHGFYLINVSSGEFSSFKKILIEK